MSYCIELIYRDYSDRQIYYNGNARWLNKKKFGKILSNSQEIVINLEIKIIKNNFITNTIYKYIIHGTHIVKIEIITKKYRRGFMANILSNINYNKIDVYLIDTDKLKYLQDKHILLIPKCYSAIYKLYDYISSFEILLPVIYIDDCISLEQDKFKFIMESRHPDHEY